MKTKLLFLMGIFSLFVGYAQPDVSTDLTTIASGLDNPTDIKVANDILYVATTTQILAYDLTEGTPSATVIFTVPTATATSQDFITAFNIRNNSAILVAHERINPSADTFIETNVTRILLSDTNNTLVVDTSTDYVSAVTFDGNMLYRAIESEEDDTTYIVSRDVSIADSPFTTITNTDDVVNDLAIYKGNLLVSSRTNKISHLSLSASSPVLVPLNISENTINSKGIQVINDGLFYTSKNFIYEGYLTDEIVYVDTYELIKNETYNLEETNTDFSDVFIYKGTAFATLAESGLVIKILLANNENCADTPGTTFTNITEDLEFSDNVTVYNNEIYFTEQLKGISKINLNTQTKTLLYTTSKIGTDYEIIQDLIVEGTTLYFTSRIVDVSSEDFNTLSSSIKKLDVSLSNPSTITLVNATSPSNVISGIVKHNNTITYTVVDYDETAIYTLDLTSNAIQNENVTYNFSVENAKNIDSIIYLSDGEKIYKGDLDNLSNPLEIYLDNTNKGYIEGLTLTNNDIYYAIDRTIKKAPLVQNGSEFIESTIATNTSKITPGQYDTTFCSYFEDIVIDGTNVYASFSESGTIVSFNNPTLSNKTLKKDTKAPFSIKDGVLSFYQNNVVGTIYSVLGSKVLSFNTKTSTKIDLNHLSTGIYFITIGNNSYKILK